MSDSGCDLADPAIFTERDDRDGLPVMNWTVVTVASRDGGKVYGYAAMEEQTGILDRVCCGLGEAQDRADSLNSRLAGGEW